MHFLEVHFTYMKLWTRQGSVVTLNFTSLVPRPCQTLTLPRSVGDPHSGQPMIQSFQPINFSLSQFHFLMTLQAKYTNDRL